MYINAAFDVNVKHNNITLNREQNMTRIAYLS